MLTREQSLAEYDFATGRLIPDRLTRKKHHHYVELARRMLLVYRHGAGRTRQELHRSVSALFVEEADCPSRRVAAFCKLLDEGSEFDRDTRGRAAELRRQVFGWAAAAHPLVSEADRLFDHTEQAVKQEIARRLNRTWDEIDRELFADVIEFHRLLRFEGAADPLVLLSRYNVAQFQAALYGAVSMTIWARDDFKTILRYAKLARLMHTIVRDEGDGYLFHFDGPASIVQETRRYGVNMAKFLPALLSCRDWRMRAVVPVGSKGWRLRLELDHADGLHGTLPSPTEFDSDLEEDFAKQWGDVPREGWTLVREAGVLSHGQRTFIPDFEFRHEDGRAVLMEVVGFWTPEYLRAKAATLRLFAERPILLAVARKLQMDLPAMGAEPLVFGRRLRVSDVLGRLAHVRAWT